MNFPTGTIPISNRILFSKSKLAWAAITTGKPNKAALKRHSGFSMHEVKFRWNMFLSALNFSRSDQQLESSVLFNDMDPSEKGGINYFLGMGFAKLAAQELLDVPWLAHYSWYKKTGAIAWSPSRSTADLVGQQAGTNNWIVLESKGRNSGHYADALEKAVKQAKQNYFVNGQPCTLHIGSVLYRYGLGKTLKMILEDPLPTDDAPTLKLEADREFWREYYSTPFDLLNQQNESRDRFKIEMGFEMKIAEPAERLFRNLDEGAKPFKASLEELRLWTRGRRERAQSEPLDNWNGDGIIIQAS